MKKRLASRSRWLTLLRSIALWVISASPSIAGFLTVSPAGTTGPGGSITFSEIGQTDPSSANVNTDYTAMGAISVSFTVSDGSPVSLYGTAVNDTLQTWTAFSVRLSSGSASFQDPNNSFNPYGTYTDTMGWNVALSDGGLEADFSGVSLGSGDSLDLFLGLAGIAANQPLTIALTPALSVPEPSSFLLCLVALGGLGLGRLRRSRRSIALAAWVAVAFGIGIAPTTALAVGPTVAPAYQGQFSINALGTVAGSPTQMTFGPNGRIYFMTTDAGPVSYAYDPTTGTLSAPIMAAPNIRGIGIGFHGADLYLSSFDGSIHKLKDGNGNGVYGESGELDVAIVTGIPQGDHNIDQIQVAGDTLYVGIGRRTINGRSGAWTSGALDDLGGKGFFGGGTGRTYGDSAYNGTIAWIQNLNAVVDQTGSANAWSTVPPTPSPALIQKDAGPVRDVGLGKLVVHSAGTRNPFGLCLDQGGNLWFTNNFNRTATLGNGQAGFGLRGDQLNSDLSLDVHDQLFKASPGADYGYFDANWRNVNPMMTPSAPGYHLVKSTTFDNSYNKGPYTLHDPANPDGMGPSASADGCAFAYHTTLPADLVGNLFIARYNGKVTEAAGGAGRSLTYGDLVAVNPSSGKVRRVASGFGNPLAVLGDDANGRILVADVGDHIVYAIQSPGH